MEELPKQEPLVNEIPGKAIPDPNTDFGNDAFDGSAMPQSRVSARDFNDWMFGLMRPKQKVTATLSRPPVQMKTAQSGSCTPIPIHNTCDEGVPILFDDDKYRVSKGFVVENGLLIQKKSLAEQVRDQIKFPILKNTQSLINGVALLVFAVGAYLLYSELPTRPELIIGILLVTIAGNIITSNR